jgi:hypothetical protein
LSFCLNFFVVLGKWYIIIWKMYNNQVNNLTLKIALNIVLPNLAIIPMLKYIWSITLFIDFNTLHSETIKKVDQISYRKQNGNLICTNWDGKWEFLRIYKSSASQDNSKNSLISGIYIQNILKIEDFQTFRIKRSIDWIESSIILKKL